MEKKNNKGVEELGGRDNNNDLDSTLNRKKDFNKLNFACICFYAFLTGTDFAVIIPTLWDRLHLEYNGDGVFLGVVMSAYAISGVLSGLVMGKLSDDRPNKTKTFYLTSVFFSVFGHLLYFMGINKYNILLARVISGICLGAVTVALAYIAKTSSVKARTSLISLVMASRQLGLMIGPAFNLFLRKTNFMLFDTFVVNKRSSPGLFMAFVWAILFFLIATFYKEPELTTKETFDATDEKAATSVSTELVKKSPKVTTDHQITTIEKFKHFMRIEILILLLTTLFTYFNQTSLETILIPFTEETFGWDELNNSILFCIGGIVIIIGYILIRFMTIKLGDRCVLLIGIVAILIGLIIGIVCITSLENNSEKIDVINHEMNHTFNTNMTEVSAVNLSFMALKIEYRIGFALSFLLDVLGLPAIAICSASLFTKIVDNKLQGVGQGIQRGVLGIGTVLGPLFAGPFIHQVAFILFICAAMIGTIMVLVIITFRKLKPVPTRA